MYIVTLLVNPVSPVLEPVLVENLRNAWGGKDVRWLAPNEAAEFSVMRKPDSFWESWSALQGMSVDLIMQSEKDRRKKLLLADMDSTMIQQECIDELAEEAGFGKKVAAITARAMSGELLFEQALTERVQMLKGLKSSVIDTVLEDRITLMPGAKTLLATMKSNGAYSALVSGGFTAFSKQVAELLRFDEHHANKLLMADGKLTGEVAKPILGRDAKVNVFVEITARLGITPNQVLSVGDGANDLGMLHLAGTGVALHAKPAVAAQCDFRVNFGDLTALLYLQGYSRADFIG